MIIWQLLDFQAIIGHKAREVIWGNGWSRVNFPEKGGSSPREQSIGGLFGIWIARGLMKKILFKILKITFLNYHFQKKRPNILYILMYHQVNDEKRKYYPAVPIYAFENMCRFLNKHLRVIHLSQISSHFKNSNEPAAVMSFDDGHYDVIEHVWPIVSKYGFKINVNIDTEILETGKPQDSIRVYDVLNHTKASSYFNPKYFNEPVTFNAANPYGTERKFSQLLSNLGPVERRELSQDVLTKLGGKGFSYSKVLSKKDVRFLYDNGVEIGSHSHTHSLLPNLSSQQLKAELSCSKRILENICDTEIGILAFPNGKQNGSIEKTARRCGYKYFLKTEDMKNVIEVANQTSFYRINICQGSYEENLAQLFGIFQIVRKAKDIFR